MFIDEHGLNTYGVKLIAGRNYTEDEVIVTDNYDELSKVTAVTKPADELFPDERLGKPFILVISQ